MEQSDSTEQLVATVIKNAKEDLAECKRLSELFDTACKDEDKHVVNKAMGAWVTLNHAPAKTEVENMLRFFGEDGYIIPGARHAMAVQLQETCVQLREAIGEADSAHRALRE